MPIMTTLITSFIITPPRKPTSVPAPALNAPFQSLPKSNSKDTAPKNGPKTSPTIPPIKKPAIPPIMDPIKPHRVAPYFFAPMTPPR